jgi:sensor histidine kinase YesM
VLPGEEPFLAIYRLYKDSKGNIWIISRDVIYQYDKRNEKLIKITQPTVAPLTKSSNEFNNICEDRQGHIWITSARNGVFEYLPATGKYHHYYHREGDAATLASSKLTAVATDAAGRIWMGGPACLAYYQPLTKKFINYTLLNGKNEPVNSILTLYADAKGDIWAGSDAGLVQVDAHSAEPKVKKTYTAQDGLRGEQAYSIRGDQQGNIWCTTPSALCMVNPVTQRVNSLALQQEQIRSITRRLYLSACGDSLQLLSYGGYYAFDPLLFQSSRKTASVTITSFRVKEKEYYYEEQLKKNGHIHLAASQNLFTFEFGVLDFKSPDDHQYMYQLEGFDKSWLHAGGRRYASYTNLPGGDYVFVVKAINSFGDANTPEIRIPLHVDTPFYKTIWFILLVIIAILVLLYISYRYRLHNERAILSLQTKAQALEKEKTQVQYENLKQHLNPHFLFNSLTSLSSLIRIDQKMASEFLDGLSRIYRYILQSKDSETVALKDELKFIQTFINLQKTRFREGLQINIHIPEEFDYRKIVPVTLQNLIENAIKHNIVDEDTPLIIEMLVEDEWLVVRNNLQKKSFVDTSNKQGLTSLISLYKYLSDRQVTIEENEGFFTVKIPLL